MNNNKTKKEADNLPANVTPQQANEALNEIMLTGTSKAGLTEEQCLQILENTPNEALNEMTANYFDFSKAGTYNFVFEGMGTSEFTNNGVKKSIEVVKLRDKNNEKFIAGGAVLVNTCKNLDQIPSFIRVITTGEKKKSSNGGEYFEMRVLTF